jgi:hypothetical protein
MNAIEKESFANDLEIKLISFHKNEIVLPGIVPADNRIALIRQMTDSVQRVQFVTAILSKDHDPRRADPNSPLFDPIRAAVLKKRAGDLEEASWLVFLAIYCGKNLRTGWRLAAEIYGSLGKGASWTWQRVRQNNGAFSAWLAANYVDCSGKFGNHRKYESLRPTSVGTGAVVSSYVNWVSNTGSHAALIQNAINVGGGNARRAFAILYRQMEAVSRFGRTARFDYLTMLAKLQLADIDADSAYLAAATGPKRGAKLLFDGSVVSNTSSVVLEEKLARLEQFLGLGMQVMEDSICNWQKSPNLYKPFRG